MKQFIKEIASVIIGILIALFINNWNEDRKDAQYLDRIFASIEKELEESVSEIEDKIPKQLASVDSVRVYLNAEDVSIYELLMKVNGIHGPSIKTNSWNAIANSKIELIGYEKLSALAKIEEGKENLRYRIEKQTDFVLKNIEKTDKAKKEILIMTLLDIVNAEKEIQAEIENLLKDGFDMDTN